MVAFHMTAEGVYKLLERVAKAGLIDLSILCPFFVLRIADSLTFLLVYSIISAHLLKF